MKPRSVGASPPLPRWGLRFQAAKSLPPPQKSEPRNPQSVTSPAEAPGPGRLCGWSFPPFRDTAWGWGMGEA